MHGLRELTRRKFGTRMKVRHYISQRVLVFKVISLKLKLKLFRFVLDSHIYLDLQSGEHLQPAERELEPSALCADS